MQTSLRYKLEKVVGVLNNMPLDQMYSIRELAKVIDPSLSIRPNKLDKAQCYYLSRELESLSSSISTILNILVELGLVGKHIRMQGKSVRPLFYRKGLIPLIGVK